MAKIRLTVDGIDDFEAVKAHLSAHPAAGAVVVQVDEVEQTLLLDFPGLPAGDAAAQTGGLIRDLGEALLVEGKRIRGEAVD